MKNSTIEMSAVVEFLESAGAATLETLRLRRRLEALETRRESLRLQNGAVARKLTRLIQDECGREADVMREELECYRRVEAFVARVPDRLHRTILRRRYLDVGKSWAEIRDELAKDGLYYSQRHLLRLHTDALEAAQRLWNMERREGMVGQRR